MSKCFVTVINCIDGRVQKPVIEFAMKEFKADYVDMITEPGPDKVLSENQDQGIIDSIRRRVKVSAEKHQSKVIVIAGHHDCAANPVDEKKHRQQIPNAVKNITEWNLKMDVRGVWVNRDWEIELI